MNESGACLNCGTPLTGAYCSSCGQKVPHADLTLGEFLHDMTHELSHWEGKVPKTLKALFFKPGLLTQDFLAGRRARWLPPLRVYLICSVAYFVTGPLIERVTHQAARAQAGLVLKDSTGRVTTLTPEIRRQIAQGLPARILGAERLERAAMNGDKLNEVVKASWPKAMFVLLPVFALLARLAWRHQQPRYPAHLYMALHLHALWFAAWTAVTIATAFVPLHVFGPTPKEIGWPETAAVLIALAGFGYVISYTILAARRVYGGSMAKTLVKVALVGVSYLSCMGLVALSMLAYAITTM